MTLRERLKKLKRPTGGTFQSKIHGSSDQSTSTQPNITPANNPAPQTQATISLAALPPTVASTPPGDISVISARTWTCLKTFRETVDKCTSAFGPLKDVMNELVRCIDIHENAVAGQRDYEELRTQLELLFEDLKRHFSEGASPTMTASMESLCGAILNEVRLISEKQGRSTLMRHLEAERDLDDILDRYRRIQGHFERLKLNTDMNVWRIVDEHATEARLRGMTPALSACYDSAEAAIVRRRECTPETREQVLADLKLWKADKNSGKIFYLNGMAGTGKTTIATTLCAMLNREHELGASFFCSRLLPECRSVKLILPSIAYQLARFSRPFRSALSQALERDPDVHTRALRKQFEGLILNPLREVENTLPGDVVVVIDALDECEDGDGVSQVLDALLAHAPGLPIKFFVSSRPEPQIRERIGGMESQLILHELETRTVKEDIATYLRSELASMSLPERQLLVLVERAGVLFIYAATVVRYIDASNSSVDSEERLETVLGISAPGSSNHNREIDALYRAILATALENPKLEPREKERMKIVLDMVVCAQEPLTVDTLAGLLNLGTSRRVLMALEPLQSVLYISKATGTVSTLHASFPDYMLDPSRSTPYGCHAESHHQKMASFCFDRIKRNERQFNVCGLESSYVFDDQVPDLEARVERHIPQDLLYACQYCAAHLEQGGEWDQGQGLLLEFLSKRVLLWMEVLNLKKRISTGILVMDQAKSWCVKSGCPQDIKNLAHDAWRFVMMFATNPVMRCTPHIYVSMLASWPKWEQMARCYTERTNGLADVKGTRMGKRDLGLLGVFTTVRSSELTVPSPDGTRIASGLWDHGIQVWDTQSGGALIGPLRGHTDWVTALAFSSDNSRLVSGSQDKTVCVWDLRGGQMIVGPLRGHIWSISSVAFSPDGTRIASSAQDQTIRVWDAHNGKMIIGPLRGHTQGVKSVLFSPDGLRIVSGSWDWTVRVWDVQSGLTILGPLKGHADMVRSIAISHDGTRIVSGSEDKTLRVWDARNGRMALLLRGHTKSVRSVAFSPDDTRIVSGSDDKSIRLWDAQTGHGWVVIDPLRGHTEVVSFVAFSADGARIISGTHGQVWLWDAQSGKIALNPLDGHSKRVTSVAFSPDGTRIVSGSMDKTVRIWDKASGQIVTDPLRRHTRPVNSVAFSPDGARVVSCSRDKTLRVWDIGSGKTVVRPRQWHTRAILSVAFSPDGTRIVSCSADKTVRVWNGWNGQMAVGPLRGHDQWVGSVAFSPDGMRIVSGSGDKTVRLWDAQTGQMDMDPLQGHTSAVTSVAFSPEGARIVSGSWDMSFRVWDVRVGQTVFTVSGGYGGPLGPAVFSPDGRWVVSGCSDNVIRVWDVESGQTVMEPLGGHTNLISSVAFSPDGTSVVSSSTDATIRVWDVRRKDRVGELWTLDADGWVLDNDSRVLFWVPHDLRDTLLWPRNTVVISRKGTVELDFCNAKMGERWTECYSPV